MRSRSRWNFDDATFERSAASYDNPDHVSIVIHNYRWRLGLADGEPQYDDLEKRLAAGPTITVPTITLEGDANGAPHPDASAYATKFSSRYAHRVIEGGIGHNLPQEAPQACAQAWRYVLLTSQAMAGCDLTGQLTGWGTPQDPVVPAGWAHSAPGADEPRAIMTEVTQQAMTERLRGFTPAELARLRVLRARYQANRTPFTTCELAHLHFVRWLHQTGRVVR